MVDKVVIVHHVAVHIDLGMNRDRLGMTGHIVEAAVVVVVSIQEEAGIVHPDSLDVHDHPVEEVEETLLVEAVVVVAVVLVVPLFSPPFQYSDFLRRMVF